jgi:hypothetical protein
MNSKLIIVEGIPGSGKSSTAQFVSKKLSEHSILTYLYNEGSTNHPVALDGLAFLEADQYRAFLKQQVAHKELILRHVIEISGGYLFNFRQMQELLKIDWPQDVLEELERCEVYSTLSAPRIMRLTLDRWRDFAQRAYTQESVYVFECCFLQDPLTVLFGQHDCEPEIVQQHILLTADIIHMLDPILIYLNVDSVRTTLEKAIETRPRAWVEFVMDYIATQGIGKVRGWNGFEGMVQFYELLKNQQMEIIPQLGWRSLMFNVSRGDWDHIHARIISYLTGPYQQI